MAKRRTRERAEPSRKEQVMTRREREQARRVTILVGAALGMAILIVVAGLIYQLLIVPSSAVASVGNDDVSTRALSGSLSCARSSLRVARRIFLKRSS